VYTIQARLICFYVYYQVRNYVLLITEFCGDISYFLPWKLASSDPDKELNYTEDVNKKLISLRLANKHISYQLFRGWSGDTTKSCTASQLPWGSSTRLGVSPFSPGIAGMKGTHTNRAEIKPALHTLTLALSPHASIGFAVSLHSLTKDALQSLLAASARFLF
jgi:hypothetical protein